MSAIASIALAAGAITLIALACMVLLSVGFSAGYRAGCRDVSQGRVPPP